MIHKRWWNTKSDENQMLTKTLILWKLFLMRLKCWSNTNRDKKQIVKKTISIKHNLWQNPICDEIQNCDKTNIDIIHKWEKTQNNMKFQFNQLKLH